MRLIIVIISVFSVTAVAKQKSHKAHVHGEGKFIMAVDGKSLEIEMEIPADDIVGFEHKPKNSKQKKAVKTAVALLKQAQKMISLPSEAGCKSTKVSVDSALTGDADKKHGHHDDHEDHHDDGHHDDDHHKDHDDDHKDAKHADHHDEASHSEFHITYKFDCKNPKSLNKVTLELFKSFPSLKELDGQAVTANGQFAKELTAKSNVFSLVK